MKRQLWRGESTDMPACLCGNDMHHALTEAAGEDTEIRVFRCPKCRHELRLTVWLAAEA
jgi:hypothetical protein